MANRVTGAEVKFNSGVYKIQNKINGKLYIGSSVDLKFRFSCHLNDLRANRNSIYLQRAWNKYGENNFDFKVLLFCDKKNILFYEQRFIDKLNACNVLIGYNLCPIAGSPLGIKHTQMAKKNMSDGRKGMKLSDSHKCNIGKSMKRNLPKTVFKKGVSSWNKGKKMLLKQKEKISESLLGNIPSEEARTNMKIAQLKRWDTIPCSNETRKKLRLANIGKKHSEAAKIKMRESAKGRILSLETRKKISQKAKKQWQIHKIPFPTQPLKIGGI